MRMTLTYEPPIVEVNGQRFEVLRTDAQIVQDVMEMVSESALRGSAASADPGERDAAEAAHAAADPSKRPSPGAAAAACATPSERPATAASAIPSERPSSGAAPTASAASATPSERPSPTAPPSPESPTPSPLPAYLDTLLGPGARARIAAAVPGHPDAPLGDAPSLAVCEALILRAARAYANAFALRYGDDPEALS